MKSAKRMKKKLTTALLFFVILALSLSFVGCERPSFLAPFGQGDKPSTEDPNDDLMVDQNDPDPPAPVFYNQLTGLVCDEASSSCRPISVCIGNFDGSRQEGLSSADILIEAPIDSDTTRLWAVLGDPSSATKLSSVKSVREYMMPIARSFDSITAYAGTTDTPGASTGIFTGDNLDYIYNNLSSTFIKEGDALSVTGTALVQAAKAMGYATSSAVSLPYSLAEVDKKVTPSGNRISSIHFGFSQGNTVGFLYDSENGLYTRSQKGITGTDTLTGEPLAFANVILLFHNVNYYYTAQGTSFALDTQAGGDGFCYTGGGVVNVKWRTGADGSISFFDADGNTLAVNRGKTYIGMLKITDSTSVIAK